MTDFIDNASINTTVADTGWIQLHRRLLEWEWFTDINTCHLFLYLLLKANHKAQKWRGIAIGRGQLITGRKELAQGTGLSERQVRTALKKLESTGNITIKATSKFSLLTVEKYEDFQSRLSRATSKATSKRPASDQQATTNNNDNNYNNNINPPTPLKEKNRKEKLTNSRRPRLSSARYVEIKKQLGQGLPISDSEREFQRVYEAEQDRIVKSMETEQQGIKENTAIETLLKYEKKGIPLSPEQISRINAFKAGESGESILSKEIQITENVIEFPRSTEDSCLYLQEKMGLRKSMEVLDQIRLLLKQFEKEDILRMFELQKRTKNTPPTFAVLESKLMAEKYG